MSFEARVGDLETVVGALGLETFPEAEQRRLSTL